MDNLFSIICLISPGNWLVSINLSDAYLSVAIHLSSHSSLSIQPLKNLDLFQILKRVN